MAQQNFTVPASAKMATPACDQKQISALIADFDGLLNSMDGSGDQDYLRLVQGKVKSPCFLQLIIKLQIMRYTMRDEWIGCESILTNSLTFNNLTRLVSTTDCAYPYGTLDFATDPCCNQT
jgi:hypothetical protein